MLEAIISTFNAVDGFLGAAFIGAIGWIIALGNRVSVIEAENKGLRELIESRFDSVEGRLDRIERSMNGHYIKD
jgi:hypothetical protein